MIIRVLLMLSLCGSITFKGLSQNTCTASNGNWSNSSTWSNCGGGIPQDGDVVLIPDNVNLVVNSSNQYSSNGSAPLLYIYIGDNDGDTDGGNISFAGKLNLKEGSTFIVYEHSSTTANAPGSSEQIRWWNPSNSSAGSLTGNDVAFTGPSTITNASVTSGIFDPLPVEFIYVNAQEQKNNILISWATASELNNDYFTIEKSTNGTEWQSIGTIKGSGNSEEIIEYSFKDFSTPNGITYYRIKQTDIDGKFDYSSTTVIIPKLANINISIYPNPASEKLTIEAPKEIISSSNIYSSQGILIPLKDILLSSSETITTLDISSFSTGVYFLNSPFYRATFVIE